MSTHKEHITQYTAAAIQQYVQGKLSAREMHAMEKAALDDPFLADAIEGMQQALADHKEEVVTGEWQQLQQQFQARTTPAARVVAFKPFRYWQAVAAAVVVIITGVWIYYLVADTSAEKNYSLVVAKTENNKTRQPETAPVLQDEKEANRSTDSAPLKNVQPANSNKVTVPKGSYSKATRSERYMNTETNMETAPAAPVQNEITLSQPKADSGKLNSASYWGKAKDAEKDDAVAKQSAAAPPVASASMPELKKARKESAYNNNYRDRETELITIKTNDRPKKTSGISNDLTGVIKGQVTDQNSNPIANAYLQIPKNNNNFVTDKTGFFKIPVSDSIVDVAVNV